MSARIVDLANNCVHACVLGGECISVTECLLAGNTHVRMHACISVVTVQGGHSHARQHQSTVGCALPLSQLLRMACVTPLMLRTCSQLQSHDVTVTMAHSKITATATLTRAAPNLMIMAAH